MSQRVPPRMESGKPYTIHIVMRNTGDKVWCDGDSTNPGDVLVPWNPSSATFGVSEITLGPSDEISKGRLHLFSVQVTAPSVTGTVNMQWRMHDGSTEFGEPTLPTPIDVGPTLYDARYVRQSVAEKMLIDVQDRLYYDVEVTMKNTGRTTWYEADKIKLGTRAPNNNNSNFLDETDSEITRVDLDGSAAVQPGEDYTFRFTVTPDDTAADWGFQWSMIDNDAPSNRRFGTSSPFVAVDASTTVLNDAEFVSQYVPDRMLDGLEYRVFITMRNSGNTHWSAADTYRLGTKDDNDDFGETRLDIEPQLVIAPGQEYTFRGSVFGPDDAATLEWGMLQENQQTPRFGEYSAALSISPLVVRDRFVTRDGSQLIHGVEPATFHGVNKHDLLRQFYGTASTNNADDLQREVTRPMAIQALDDAALAGVQAIRVAGSPKFIATFERWHDEETKQEYWDAWEDMIEEARKRGIGLIVVLWWKEETILECVNQDQDPQAPENRCQKLVGQPREGFRDLLTSGSRAQELMKEWAEDVLGLFAASDTILFWELFNEINGPVDQDRGEAQDNYSTAELISAMSDLGNWVKVRDGNHLISSGFREPREYATARRDCPGWNIPPCLENVDLPLDTEQEAKDYFVSIHPPPIDIMSIHSYRGGRAHDRFQGAGPKTPFEPVLFRVFQDAAESADGGVGQPLYVGEYGDASLRVPKELAALDPQLTPFSAGNFIRRGAIQAWEQRLPAATIWSWQLYGGSVSSQNASSLDPADHPETVEIVSQVPVWMEAGSVTEQGARMPLSNSGFEESAGSMTDPTDWSAVSADAGTGWTFERQSNEHEAFEGEWELKLFNGTGGVPTLLAESSSVAVAPGQINVLVSAALKSELVDSGWVLIELEESDASGPLPGTPDRRYIHHDGGATGRYRVEPVLFPVTPGATTLKVRIGVGGAEGLALTIDDVWLTSGY